jgi:hypothetical protein
MTENQRVQEADKLAIAIDALDSLSIEILKSSDNATLRKFRELSQHWAELADIELTMRELESKADDSLDITNH